MIAVFLSLFAILLIAFLQSASYGSRVALHLKSDTQYWGNPYNLMFYPDKLTEEGLRQRRLCLIWLGVFVGAMFAVAVLACGYERFFK
jgi:hypothetical protein